MIQKGKTDKSTIILENFKIQSQVLVEQLNKNQLSTQPLIKFTFVDLYTQQHRIQFLSKKQCEGKLENISNFKIMKNTTY